MNKIPHAVHLAIPKAQHHLCSLVRSFREKQFRVLVVGDEIQDDYRFGRVDRMSPEAPVPVFIEERQETRFGGAANVVANLTALGIASIATVGVPRSRKLRYMVGSHHLLRVDYDESGKIQQELPDIQKKLDIANALVLSDYAKGALTEDWCSWFIARARERTIPVVIDPKGADWTKYARAHYICPNAAEYRAHLDDRTQPEKPAFRAVFEKRGAAGIRVHTNGSHLDFPALARHVYDVTGAGDTVVAVIAAVLAAKGSIEDAATLANLAAGIVVAEIGTSACTAAQLIAALNEGVIA